MLEVEVGSLIHQVTRHERVFRRRKMKERDLVPLSTRHWVPGGVTYCYLLPYPTSIPVNVVAKNPLLAKRFEGLNICL